MADAFANTVQLLDSWGTLAAVPILGIVAMASLYLVYLSVVRRRDDDDGSADD